MPRVPPGPAQGIPVTAASESNLATLALSYSVPYTTPPTRPKLPYVWGGGSLTRGADCSGFVGQIILKAGITVPGVREGIHGPPVIFYVTWKGAGTIPQGSQQAGDLAIWPGIAAGGHIGILTGPDSMVSELNTQYGCVSSPVHGFGPTGVPVMYRRVNGTGGVFAPGCATQTAATGAVALIVGRMLWKTLRH